MKGWVPGIAWVAAALLIAHGAPQRSAAKAPELTAACGTTNPYLAVARFAAPKNYRLDPDAPSVVALRDTAADDVGSQVTLATQGQTGAVFGLAYDAGRGQVYASAYHKRGAPFGPGGTGGIYRIDLAAGTVRTLTSLQGGLDRHDLKDRDDELAGLWVGRASLGDIDLAPDGSQLFAANLFDGKVYRLRLPDGAVLGSFRHGGYGKTWQRDARLFALAVDERWLYHGVMDMGRVNQRPATAHVFRSDWNGSAMEEVTQFEAGVAMADEGNPGPGTLLFTDMALIASALPGADKVILLLTDGLPTTGTGDEAQDAATAARRLGIDLWAIGLGGDADPDFLRQLTGSAVRVRVAPGARDLEAVYKQVAGALTCR